MSTWTIVYRFAWGLLGILFIIGLLCVFLPKCYEFRELQRKKTELQAENRRLEDLIAELRMNQHRFETDPEFMERVARETGMIREDEIVFKFTNGVEAVNETTQ